MEKQKTKLIKLWNELKRKYNNTYIDVRVVKELNKRGVGIYQPHYF